MTQRTLVLVVPPSERAALRASLAAGPFDFRSVPHALFSVKGEGAVATLYASGKLVVQAAEPEVFAERWLRAAIPPPRDAATVTEQTPTVQSRPATAGPVVGSDEVGKGDYFGPLVVCAVRLEPGQSQEIERSGVRDSKTLSDEQCLRLGGALRARYAAAVERLDPRDYNRVYVPGKLNELLADLHAKALARLAQPGDRVVVDRFANERLLQTRLKGLPIRLEQRTRAESEPAVAAASVIAREEFLLALRELSAEHAVDLRKGAGSPVDQAARRFVTLHGIEALANVAKLHFKNTQKLRWAGGRTP
ncbi:MAG: ribonuclease HIII [Planctomycetes bacterium]|nr:ribonuclease HIII [Planctomycetota bacterium]